MQDWPNTDYCTLDVDKKSKIATITFNKPERMNAAKTADWVTLTRTVIKAEEDENVKVIIFKGAGENFGTGHHVADLGAHHGWSPDPKARRPSQRRRMVMDDDVFFGRRGMCQTILSCDKVTIAQVHGYCYGGHMSIALACDIVIASDDSMYVHPGFRYIGPLGELVLYIHTMGIRRAKQMMLSGNPLNAAEAAECGLITKVVPMDKLEAEVNKMANIIARQPFDAIVLGKANFELALDIIGTGTGYTAGYISHVLQTNIRFEDDEFNLFREKNKKGVDGAFKEREARFADSPLRKPKAAAKATAKAVAKPATKTAAKPAAKAAAKSAVKAATKTASKLSKK